MRSDIFETADAFVVEIDLPGVAKEKIQAYVEKEYLTVEADFSREPGESKMIRRERCAGKCQRRYYVGEIRTEDLRASYQNGVLVITIPKSAYRKAEEQRRIVIA